MESESESVYVNKPGDKLRVDHVVRVHTSKTYREGEDEAGEDDDNSVEGDAIMCYNVDIMCSKQACT